jgi:DNA-binding YbaB/EbfC family protein
MFGNMGELFGKINDFQGKIKSMKDQLATESVSAESGGGMVKVVVNGNKELVKLTIEKELMNPNDAEMLADLIVAAVNKGYANADDLAKRRMEELTKNMIPGGIPGFDMSKFGL